MFLLRPVLLDTFKKHIIEIGKMFRPESTMSCKDELETQILEQCKAIVPKLTHEFHKGMAGRIGIIGGSPDYTGAPYFAAISALKVGCDLAHIFCAREAAPVIKSYSPELIVHPVLDAPNAYDLVLPWLPRLHALVIGPGLGRDPTIVKTVTEIVNYCRDSLEHQMPLVIDADGLSIITDKPQVIKDYPHGAILTPNAIEFSRLVKSILGLDFEHDPSPNPDPKNVQTLAKAIGTDIVVLHKGGSDVIAAGSGDNLVKCSANGSARRCGGQGDLLSGSLGTFYYWARQKFINPEEDETFYYRACQKSRISGEQQFPPAVVAAYAACRLTRECNQRAFAKYGRSTLTTDMLNEIHSAFELLFEN